MWLRVEGENAAANPHAVASVTCINTGILLGYRWHYLARGFRPLSPLTGVREVIFICADFLGFNSFSGCPPDWDEAVNSGAITSVSRYFAWFVVSAAGRNRGVVCWP
jgi:hypothetical protein